MPGLFKLILKTRNLVIANSINVKKKTSVNSFLNISLFSETEVCGLVEEFPLVEIFEKIFQYKIVSKIRIKLN